MKFATKWKMKIIKFQYRVKKNHINTLMINK